MIASIFAAVTAAKRAGAFQTWEWSLLAIPVLGLVAVVTYLVASGEYEGRNLVLAPFYRAGSSLRRITGVPAWSIGGIGIQMWSILVAGVGFYWDVAWHADLGRDKDLFTPPHIMILIGLMGFGIAALVSVIFANLENTKTGFRILRLRVPYAALPLGILSLGASLGFPLDDMWHRTYGIDVTMWSPTHLIMIGGAVMTPIASRLLLAEAGPAALESRIGRAVRRAINASMLTGLSALMLEFDLGIPQWQALYQPVLMALATGIALVAARVTLGRFGALAVTINFLVLRIFFAVIVGPVLGQQTPRFPIYIGVALAVEAAWYLGERMRLRPVAMALLAGGAIGTIGLASEWAWSHVWGYLPWQPTMLPGMWVALAMAFGASLVGLAMGSVLAYRKSPLNWRWVLAIGVVMVGLLFVPYPRTTVPATVTVHATPVGEPVASTDRDGLPAVIQDYNVSLEVTPPALATGANWFELMSWQGGTEHATTLVPDGGGRYHGATSVPTGGTWKTIVLYAKNDVMMAVPISMPVDSAFGQVGTKVADVTGKTVPFQPSERILLSEQHDASNTIKVVAYAFFFLMFGTVFVLLGFSYTKVNRRIDMPYGGGPWPEPPAGEKPSGRKPAFRPAPEAS